MVNSCHEDKCTSVSRVRATSLFCSLSSVKGFRPYFVSSEREGILLKAEEGMSEDIPNMCVLCDFKVLVYWDQLLSRWM